jgi:NAD-dependent dihydropyrimidine dehydrogenase PreA subunit
MAITIDIAKCAGCGTCVEECPEQAISSNSQ